jgi:hypothetical protein
VRCRDLLLREGHNEARLFESVLAHAAGSKAVVRVYGDRKGSDIRFRRWAAKQGLEVVPGPEGWLYLEGYAPILFDGGRSRPWWRFW